MIDLAKLIKILSEPAPVRIQVFPFGVDFKRTLTPVNQLDMGADSTLNEKSCGPASAASCLKYFADNGHPELDNPGGDTSKPDQSGEEMGRELRGAMRTNSSEGTTPEGMVAGIKSYLDSHGKTGWTVEKTLAINPVWAEAMQRKLLPGSPIGGLETTQHDTDGITS